MRAYYWGWIQRHPLISLAIAGFILLVTAALAYGAWEDRDVDFAPFNKDEIISGWAFCYFEELGGYNPHTVVFSDTLGQQYGQMMRDVEYAVDAGNRTLEDVYLDTERTCGAGATARFQSYFEE